MASFREKSEELNSENMKRVLALDSLHLAKNTVEDIARWKNTEATYIATTLKGREGAEIEEPLYSKMLNNAGSYDEDAIIKWAEIYYNFFEKIMNK